MVGKMDEIDAQKCQRCSACEESSDIEHDYESTHETHNDLLVGERTEYIHGSTCDEFESTKV